MSRLKDVIGVGKRVYDKRTKNTGKVVEMAELFGTKYAWVIWDRGDPTMVDTKYLEAEE